MGVALLPRVSRSYLALIALSLSIAALFSLRGLRLRFADAEAVVIAFGFLILTGHLLQQRTMHRIGSALELVPLFMMVSLSFTLVGIDVAAGGMPLADAKLADADRALFPFVDWPSFVFALARQDNWVIAVANFAYSSMGWQVLLVVVLGSLAGRRAACDRFLMTWITALSLTMVIHAILPAAGAFQFYSISHTAVPAIQGNAGWHQAEIIHDLRSGAIKTVDWSTLEGLISFPSFHAAAAVILARSYWIYGLLKWPAAVLNLLMTAAAVPCGGHYFIDILAGVAVALVALLIVERNQFGTAMRGRSRRLKRSQALLVNPITVVDRGAR